MFFVRARYRWDVVYFQIYKDTHTSNKLPNKNSFTPFEEILMISPGIFNWFLFDVEHDILFREEGMVERSLKTINFLIKTIGY